MENKANVNTSRVSRLRTPSTVEKLRSMAQPVQKQPEQPTLKRKSPTKQPPARKVSRSSGLRERSIQNGAKTQSRNGAKNTSTLTRKKSRAELLAERRAALAEKRAQESVKTRARVSTGKTTQTRSHVGVTRTSSATSTTAKRRTSSTSSSSTGASSNSRKSWDIRGRLQDLEKFTEQLKSQVRNGNEKVEELTSQLEERETDVSHLSHVKETIEHQSHSYKAELDDAKRAQSELRLQIEGLRLEQTRKTEESESKQRALNSEIESLNLKVRISTEECERLKVQTLTQKVEMGQMQSTIDTLESTVKARDQTIIDQLEKIAKLEGELASQLETVQELETDAREHETMRRKLHNTIQELRGNIRVFCRVRPLLASEIEKDAQPLKIDFNKNKRAFSIEGESERSLSGKKREGKVSEFKYDKVFAHDSTQSAVFDEISQLVQSALDGYNVCVFAYGQTNSGKTFTMEGPPAKYANDTTQGMIPRAVEQIFESAMSLIDQGWNYQMYGQFVEIYNETIRDLLCVDESAVASAKYDIKHDKAGNTVVTDVTVVPVETPGQVQELLQRATRNRSVGKTQMNERSSRSHRVFTLTLKGRNGITGETAKGVLNLIDLAGSERLASSGATGSRLKETQAINKSLSSLGDVIAALANKSSHVPYRNSKLTYLLKNSLGGNSKTLMFCNISPLSENYNETVSTLRFATKVNACQIGTARKDAKIDFNK